MLQWLQKDRAANQAEGKGKSKGKEESPSKRRKSSRPETQVVESTNLTADLARLTLRNSRKIRDLNQAVFGCFLHKKGPITEEMANAMQGFMENVDVARANKEVPTPPQRWAFLGLLEGLLKMLPDDVDWLT